MRRSHEHLLALVVTVWSGACGSDDSMGTSGQATAGDASSEGEPTTSTTAGPSDGSTSPSTSDANTGSSTLADTMGDSTSDEPNGCAALCGPLIECGVGTMLEVCVADCEATAPLLQSCVLACDPTVCDELLACTTLCANPGDPTAPPYASCQGECQPGVNVCIATSQPDGAEFSVCAPYCDQDGQCPVAKTGTAPPRCDLETIPPVCSLDCSAGQQCPDDMACADGLCTWPVP